MTDCRRPGGNWGEGIGATRVGFDVDKGVVCGLLWVEQTQRRPLYPPPVGSRPCDVLQLTINSILLPTYPLHPTPTNAKPHKHTVCNPKS